MRSAEVGRGIGSLAQALVELQVVMPKDDHCSLLALPRPMLCAEVHSRAWVVFGERTV